MAGRRIYIPKEHGAWAMLLMPYVVGVGVAGRLVPETALFLLAAMAWFAARYPLNLLLKSGRCQAMRERGEAFLWLAGYAGVAVLASGLLVFGYGRWALLPLGVVALLLMAMQPALQRNRLDRTVLGELLAFAGLALTGPGVYYASTGRVDGTAALVWLLTFFYAGASVFYVKLRVKQRTLRAATLGLSERLALGFDLALYQTIVLAAVLVLAAARQVPWLALVAFAPLTYKVCRDIWRVAPELNLRRLGFVEVGHSLAFVALLVGAYAVRWPPVPVSLSSQAKCPPARSERFSAWGGVGHVWNTDATERAQKTRRLPAEQAQREHLMSPERTAATRRGAVACPMVATPGDSRQHERQHGTTLV